MAASQSVDRDPANDSAAVPRFGVGMKLRFDQVRGTWVVLGPERLFLPDEHALEVLKLVDGVRSVAAIATALAERFAASASDIEADIWPMLHDLSARGAIRL
jgi:pyrroloquinoline quinone biosynthesis protein D